MYNYKLIHLGYKPVFFFMFTGGICTGSVVSLLFILLDRSSLGFLGSAFLTLLAGLASGLASLIYVFAFNTLAPAIGGIPLTIVPFTNTPPQEPNRDSSPPLS